MVVLVQVLFRFDPTAEFAVGKSAYAMYYDAIYDIGLV